MTPSIAGRLFDGSSAAYVETELTIDAEGRLRAGVPGTEPAPHIREVRVSSRLGSVPRRIVFPSGAVFETGEQDAVDAWLAAHGVAAGVAHKLESRLRYALGAVVVVGAFIAAAGVWGVPWLAGIVAPLIPSGITRTIGSDTLDYLDRLVLEESALRPARRRELESLFAGLVPADSKDFDYRLELRGGGLIQANAFALPNGTIVATDELVNLLRDDEEIAAVLLHEIGHVEHRHGLQIVLSHSGLAALTLLVFGDVNAAGAIVVALPNVLLGSAYSRDLEREADDFALARLAEVEIPAARFADALEGLQAYYERDCEAHARAGVKPPKKCTRSTGREDAESAASDDEPGGEAAWLEYVSTHPATAERIARIRGAR